jgi:ppGpp synthetase/RelA/SpoT-type nucleotidyltranferase
MPLSDEALRFYETYQANYGRMEGAAAAAEFLVGDALRDLPVEIHAVTGRAKRPLSLLKKLRNGGYKDPAVQLTDQVAVRVIAYYEDHIDPIVERLSERFEVKPGESQDLAGRLPVGAFGYRSHHLVVRAAVDGLAGSQAQGLRGLWFEIQVRSVLAHAWAEIEHEVVYKSGSEIPDGLKARFAEIAASLGVADREFIRLRQDRDALVTGYAEQYARDEDWDQPLDASRLMAAFEVIRPNGLSFRNAQALGTSFPAHIETTCLDALVDAGVRNGSELRERLGDGRCVRCLENYGALADIPPAEISHYSAAVIAAGCGDPERFMSQFPDLLEDEILARALAPDPDDDAGLDEPPP